MKKFLATILTALALATGALIGVAPPASAQAGCVEGGWFEGHYNVYHLVVCDGNHYVFDGFGPGGVYLGTSAHYWKAHRSSQIIYPGTLGSQPIKVEFDGAGIFTGFIWEGPAYGVYNGLALSQYSDFYEGNLWDLSVYVTVTHAPGWPDSNYAYSVLNLF